jgi:hypothetical protein
MNVNLSLEKTCSTPLTYTAVSVVRHCVHACHSPASMNIVPTINITTLVRLTSRDLHGSLSSSRLPGNIPETSLHQLEASGPRSVVLRSARNVDGNGNHFLSPSSALVRQTLTSPSVTAPDKEFTFDCVQDTNATQEQVWIECGRPIALRVMRELQQKLLQQTKKLNSSITESSFLTVCYGLDPSLTSHTCWVGSDTSSISSIKGTRTSRSCFHRNGHESNDGLLPRIIESLFSQSRHQKLNDGAASCRFGVDCSVELVGYLPKRHSRTRRRDNAASKIEILDIFQMQQMNESDLQASWGAKAVRLRSRFFPSRKRPNKETNDQKEWCLPQSKRVYSSSNAREIIFDAIANANRYFADKNRRATSRLTNPQAFLITLKPFWKRQGSPQFSAAYVYGSTIALLELSVSELREHNTPRRGGAALDALSCAREEIPSLPPNAYDSLMQCLRSLRQNQNDELQDDFNFNQQTSNHLNFSLRIIPYKRHPVTQVLRSILESTPSLMVTLILTAYTTEILSEETGDRKIYQGLLTDLAKLSETRPKHQMRNGVVLGVQVAGANDGKSSPPKETAMKWSARIEKSAIVPVSNAIATTFSGLSATVKLAVSKAIPVDPDGYHGNTNINILRQCKESQLPITSSAKLNHSTHVVQDEDWIPAATAPIECIHRGSMNEVNILYPNIRTDPLEAEQALNFPAVSGLKHHVLLQSNTGTLESIFKDLDVLRKKAHFLELHNQRLKKENKSLRQENATMSKQLASFDDDSVAKGIVSPSPTTNDIGCPAEQKPLLSLLDGDADLNSDDEISSSPYTNQIIDSLFEYFNQLKKET